MHDDRELDVRAFYTAVSVSLCSLSLYKQSHAFSLFPHPAFTSQSFLVHIYIFNGFPYTLFYQVGSVDKLVENLGKITLQGLF